MGLESSWIFHKGVEGRGLSGWLRTCSHCGWHTLPDAARVVVDLQRSTVVVIKVSCLST